MKLVVNGSYGGFSFPNEYVAKIIGFSEADNEEAYWDAYNEKIEDHRDELRFDPELIAIVEADDYDGDLSIAELPEGYTDYEISEYDGAEDVIAVVNGKIVHCF